MDIEKQREFMLELLKMKGVSSSDNKRLLQLVASQMSSMLGSSERNADTAKSNDAPSFTHSPAQMVSFLYRFSQNDNLKWLTHHPDDESQSFDYVSYMAQAKRTLDSLRNEYTSINPQTWLLANNYVFGGPTSFWVSYDGRRHDLNWRSPALLSWVESNPSVHPFFSELKENGVSFADTINIFKHTISFRTDVYDQSFYKRLRTLIKNKLSDDFKVEYSDALREASVYLMIDARRFNNALGKILEWISDNKAKGCKVVVNIVEHVDSFDLVIWHVDSTLDVPDKKLEGMDGDMAEVRKNLFSIADWTIAADRSDGSSIIIKSVQENMIARREPGRVTLVSKTVLVKGVEKIGGVKHIIKLYKNV